MEPEISYLVAAYNSAAFVSRAVLSALAQTGVAVEVVVVDDGSSDATVDVVRAIVDPRVRLVVLPQNLGPSGARNAGFEAARGRYVAILDSDDHVHERRSERLMLLARRTGAEVLVDNIEMSLDPGGEPSPMFDEAFLATHQAITLAELIDANSPFASRFNFGYLKPVFERAFVKRHGLCYDEGLRIGEDYLFFASVLASGGRCAVEPKIGYTYDVRPGSISRVLKAGDVRDMISSDRRFIGRFPLEGAARAAFDRRGRSLSDAEAFLTVIEHLKARDLAKAFVGAFRNPAAMRHFRMPVHARWRRMADRLQMLQKQ